MIPMCLSPVVLERMAHSPPSADGWVLEAQSRCHTQVCVTYLADLSDHLEQMGEPLDQESADPSLSD